MHLPKHDTSILDEREINHFMARSRQIVVVRIVDVHRTDIRGNPRTNKL